MRYYVYENYPTSTATVHEGSCRNCNEGKGKRGATEERAIHIHNKEVGELLREY